MHHSFSECFRYAAIDCSAQFRTISEHIQVLTRSNTIRLRENVSSHFVIC